MKEIIKNTRGREITPRPEFPITERTDMGILGQITHQVGALDEISAFKTSEFDKGSREKEKSNVEKGIGSMHQLLKNPDPPKVDTLLLGSRITYLSEFGLDDES